MCQALCRYFTSSEGGMSIPFLQMRTKVLQGQSNAACKW